MAVEEQISRTTYKGNGVTREFPFTWDLEAEEYVTVKLTNAETEEVTTLELGTDYDVIPDSEEFPTKGGTIVYPKGEVKPAITDVFRLTIMRSVPYVQSLVFPENTRLVPKNIERGLDNLEYQIQQLNDSVGQCVALPPGVDYTGEELLDRIYEASREARSSATNAEKSASEAKQSADEALESAQKADTVIKSINIKTFANVAEMKSSETIVTGTLCRTQGFYTAGDGGGADYLITDSSDEDEADEASIITLQNGLYAKLLAQGYVNVEQLGVKGDGITDDTGALQKALTFCKDKYMLLLSNGEYLVSKTLIAENVTIKGLDKAFLSVANITNNNKQIIKAINNVDIINITAKFSADINDINESEACLVGIEGSINTGKNIKIDSCNVFGGHLLYTDLTEEGRAVVWSQDEQWIENEDMLCDNISVINCYCNCGYTDNSVKGRQAIDFRFVKNFIATNNVLENVGYGIQWWGGFTNYFVSDIALKKYAYKMLCRKGVISNNIVKNTIAGIWGFKGDGITITGNVVESCSDVGIDTESCDNITVISNVVKDCRNACLATFDVCNNVIFKNNVIKQYQQGEDDYIWERGAGYFHTWKGKKEDYEALNKPKFSIAVTDNSFYSTRKAPTLACDLQTESTGLNGDCPLNGFIFSNNYIVNMGINIVSKSYLGDVDVNNNTIIIENDFATFFSSVLLVSPTFGYININNNVIKNKNAKADSNLIYIVNIGDTIENNINVNIKDNICIGIPSGYGVCVGVADNINTNNDNYYNVYIANNVVSKTEGKNSIWLTSKNTIKVFLDNNKTDTYKNEPNSKPSGMLWQSGQRIFYDLPVNGKIGCICTVTGNPGTWEEF